MRAIRFVKNVSVYAAIILVTIIVLDTILYFALPERITERFPAYREGTYVVDVIGRGYPKNYFETHPDRGFDIKPTPVQRTDQIHYMDEYSYPVWSNAIGCFDEPVRKETESRFWYMAGDSIAWGHARFEELMGTIIEEQTGVEVLQCGVTHTGQRHQFSKFREISHSLGKWPERVLVFYSPTDAANDYMHPHSTVVDGGLADIRMLDEGNEPVSLDQAWFEQIRKEREAARPGDDGQPTTFSLSRFLMKYSMSSQILNVGLHRLEEHAPFIGRQIGVLGEEPGLEWHEKYFRYKGKKLYDLHRLTYFQTSDGYLEYSDYEYARDNKAVIKEWRDHARANGYKLEFVLPHPGPSRAYEGMDVTNFYKEFIAYLSALGIKYYDLSSELNKREIETEDLYWEEDIHMSGRGNRIVGKILAELL